MAEHTERNRQYFDKLAKSYTSDFKSILESICRLVDSHRPWINDAWIDTEAGKGKDIKMLEYACGTGPVSLTLAPFVSKIVGLDVSDNMISEYNNNAKEAGYEDKMVALKGDLLAESAPAELSGPEYFDFDLVVVSMALHHFERPELAMARFGERLKKGGVCVIVDIVPDDHHHGHCHNVEHGFGDAAHTVKSHGFTMDQMKQLYEEAGLGTGFKYDISKEQVVFRKDGKEHLKTIFIARGQRA
ncbi:SAM-dependent methyltransferase [Aspergillus costaricaensis CBS 115574]|uniref:SAM-dependent methyltransferase n=1 Tax=Aspergillus costaricaensis CBS 115574 TaxID=1448317 RepID=A0ACD1IHK2_9EURO|nr:SAM-dependent methyltransferase [Aspergillus costaricaensis CBS 115574]RAK89507.1 SAM-dependent methyltransferase [Aspergillus costaricaensis CBS 115574]